MILLKSLTKMVMSGRRLVVSAVAIAPLLLPSAGLAQNQSDVTGPNLSDITGPNLSDVTGPNLSDNTGTNQSDNTGLLGDPLVGSPGEEVALSELFRDFFDEFGEELGIDPDASLAEQLRQAKQACSEGAAVRRFARDPGPDFQTTPACIELDRLIRLAQEALEEYSQSRREPSSENQRLW